MADTSKQIQPIRKKGKSRSRRTETLGDRQNSAMEDIDESDKRSRSARRSESSSSESEDLPEPQLITDGNDQQNLANFLQQSIAKTTQQTSRK